MPQKFVQAYHRQFHILYAYRAIVVKIKPQPCLRCRYCAIRISVPDVFDYLIHILEGNFDETGNSLCVLLVDKEHFWNDGSQLPADDCEKMLTVLFDQIEFVVKVYVAIDKLIYRVAFDSI